LGTLETLAHGLAAARSELGGGVEDVTRVICSCRDFAGTVPNYVKLYAKILGLGEDVEFEDSKQGDVPDAAQREDGAPGELL
jgi:hypothetical protein